MKRELIDIIDALDGAGLVITDPKEIRNALAGMNIPIDTLVPDLDDQRDMPVDTHFGFTRDDVFSHASDRAEELDAEDDGMDHTFSSEEIDHVWAKFKAQTKHGESMSIVEMNELIVNLLDAEHSGPMISGVVGGATEVSR
jgi:hypothetical protein